MKEQNTMSHIKNLDWINEVRETIEPSGILQVEGQPIILQWVCIDPKEEELNATIKQISPILVEEYSKMECEFAQQFPSQAKQEMFFKSSIPLLEANEVCWTWVEDNLFDSIEAFFESQDFAQYSGEHDITIFINAYYLPTHEHIGVMQLLITPDYHYGTVKVALYGTLNSDENIKKFLMSSIFSLLPYTQRIFLHTRITNQSLISLLKKWEFQLFEGPLEYWTDLEYLAHEKQKIQLLAKQLKR